jgi:hypothetical protein
MFRGLLGRLSVWVLFAALAAFLSAACGGSDVVDSADAADATSDQGETPPPDATSDEKTDSTDALPEGSAGSLDVSAGETEPSESSGPDGESGGDASRDASRESGDEDSGSADGAIEGGTIAPPALGTARTFAVLAGSTITNTGTATAIVGDVGISPGTALVGLTAGQVTGTLHLGDALAMMAEADLTTAYNDLARRPCEHTMTDVDLGGKTLPPGVYCFAVAAAQTVGDLTLDGEGDPNAVWIFQIGSTLTISSNLSTTLIHGGNACNVYWQVGSSATINGGAQVKGNVFAQASISLLDGANVGPGRTLTQTAAVTMQSTGISNAGCP